jgi:hypothetical protein
MSADFCFAYIICALIPVIGTRCVIGFAAAVASSAAAAPSCTFVPAGQGIAVIARRIVGLVRMSADFCFAYIICALIPVIRARKVVRPANAIGAGSAAADPGCAYVPAGRGIAVIADRANGLVRMSTGSQTIANILRAKVPLIGTSCAVRFSCAVRYMIKWLTLIFAGSACAIARGRLIGPIRILYRRIVQITRNRPPGLRVVADGRPAITAVPHIPCLASPTTRLAGVIARERLVLRVNIRRLLMKRRILNGVTPLRKLIHRRNGIAGIRNANTAGIMKIVVTVELARLGLSRGRAARNIIVQNLLRPVPTREIRRWAYAWRGIDRISTDAHIRNAGIRVAVAVHQDILTMRVSVTIKCALVKYPQAGFRLARRVRRVRTVRDVHHPGNRYGSRNVHSSARTNNRMGRLAGVIA